jgi:hypothetical protein
MPKNKIGSFDIDMDGTFRCTLPQVICTSVLDRDNIFDVDVETMGSHSKNGEVKSGLHGA